LPPSTDQQESPTVRPAPGIATPDQYLASQPADRRRELSAVRELVREHVAHGFQEELLAGMIMWVIPRSRYPDTYNRQPLCYVALAARKDYCSLHLMSCYGDAGQLAALRHAFAAAGKKLDMGKSCVRFRKAGDLPLAAIGKLIAAINAEQWIALYEKSRLMTKAGRLRAQAAPSAARARRTSG
jgi:hypothetical protein